MKVIPLAILALLAAQGEAPLRRTLKEGTDTYKIDSKVSQNISGGPGGDMTVNITSSMTYALKTTKVDDAAGSATVEATTTIDKIDADGPVGQMLAQQKPAPVTQTGKLDVRGRLTFDKTAAAGGLMAMMSGAQSTASSGTFVEFPEKSGKIGDTWEIVVPKNPMMLDQDQKLTEKLVGEKDLDGVPVWVVSITGTLKTNLDTSKLPKDPKAEDSPMGQMTAIIKGETELTGEGLVDKATGKTLLMTTTGKLKSNIDLGVMQMDTTGKIESTVKLVKP